MSVNQQTSWFCTVETKFIMMLVITDIIDIRDMLHTHNYSKHDMHKQNETYEIIKFTTKGNVL